MTLPPIAPPLAESRTKQGNHARYSISDPSLFDFCDQVCGGVRRHLHDLETILQPTA